MPLPTRATFITGIAGFIGFHIASSLNKRGEYVIGCDNFNPYYSPALKRARAARLKGLGIQILETDLQHLPPLPQHITHVIHLAAQAGVRSSITHPYPYVENNLLAFLHLLERCRALPSVKLIFASSSSVYGNETELPVAETAPTDSPVSLYAATKKGGELMAKSYHYLYQIPMVGLRFFTVYGPWGRPDMAYYTFAKNILQNTPLSLFNQGNMARDFTYIDDIVQGTLGALDVCNGFEIYNLGNNKPHPVRYLVELLEYHLGKRASIELLPMQSGDVYTTCADIQKAQTHLGFAPTISLEEGIARFAQWLLESQEIY